MEEIYLACFVLWLIFTGYKYHGYKRDIDKKKYAQRIISRLTPEYIKEKRFKELYTYDNKAFEEQNFLYDFFVGNANVLLNKKIDHEILISYANMLGIAGFGWLILLGGIIHGQLIFPLPMKIVLGLICCGLSVSIFYNMVVSFENDKSYRGDPLYLSKRETELSSRWRRYVAPKLKVREDQIIRDAEELAEMFY